jgi:hypothetical protein
MRRGKVFTPPSIPAIRLAIAVLAASLGMTKGLLKPLVVSNYMSSGATKLFRQVSRPKRPAPSF